MDYSTVNEELTIGSNLSPSFPVIHIIDDQFVEPNETFLLILTSNNTLVNVTTPNITIIIFDNERRKYLIHHKIVSHYLNDGSYFIMYVPIYTPTATLALTCIMVLDLNHWNVEYALMQLHLSSIFKYMHS